MNGIKAVDTYWQIDFRNDSAILGSERLGREEASVQYLSTDCVSSICH